MDSIVLQIQDGRGFFSQSGAELKIQDGSANKSEAMLENSPPASRETFPWQPNYLKNSGWQHPG